MNNGSRITLPKALDFAKLVYPDSFFQVSFPIVGASPDVHTFIQMKEKEDKKKTGEGTDKRSFLAKYWMYILPVALLLMMSMGQ